MNNGSLSTSEFPYFLLATNCWILVKSHILMIILKVHKHNSQEKEMQPAAEKCPHLCS